MSDTQLFELKSWADADVQIGPGNPAHPDHAAWLAAQDQTRQPVEPADDNEGGSK